MYRDFFFFFSYIINTRKAMVGHGIDIPHASVNFYEVWKKRKTII